MALKTVSEQAATPVPEGGSTGDAWRDQRIAWRQAIDTNRDQWGRPKVALPASSKTPGKEVGYRRASSYGSPLEDATNLELWKMRQVARGIARNRALRLEVTRAEVGLDGAEAEAKASKKELNDIAKRAMDVVGSGDAASIGTSLHDVCELIDRGVDPGHVPEEYLADVEAYRVLVAGFRMVSIERFVVQDEHRVAGTLDRAGELLAPIITPWGLPVAAGDVVIVDQKTAQRMDFAGPKFGVQGWIYATGEPYDPVQKVRVPWGHAQPRADVAVIAHTPSGLGTADLYAIDLQEAGLAAEIAREVYDWRNWRGKRLITKTETAAVMVERWKETVASAADLDALKALARQANTAGAWCDPIRELFTARKTELVDQGAKVAA